MGIWPTQTSVWATLTMLGLMVTASVGQASDLAGQKMLNVENKVSASLAAVTPTADVPVAPSATTEVRPDVPEIMRDEPEALPAAVSDTAEVDEKGCPRAPKGPPACLPMTGSFDDSNDLADCLSQMNTYVMGMNRAYVCSRDPALREEMRRVARDFADAAGSTH